MAVWAYRKGNAEIQVNPEQLSRHLVVFGGPLVTALAEKGEVIAAGQTRDPREEALIGSKTNIEAPKPSGFPLESTRLKELTRHLAIPVALIYNNSKNAFAQEVGSADGKIPATRPLLTAYSRLRSQAGVTGIRQKVKYASTGSFRKEADAAARARRRKR